MNIKYSITLLIALYAFNTFSQENLIFNKVNEQKMLGSEYIDIKNIFRSADPDYELLSKANDGSNISFYTYDKSLFSTLGKTISINIPTNRGDITLELFHVPSAFYNYNIITSDGNKIGANQNIKHYRGVVKDKELSLAAFTFSEDEVIGLVATEEGNFNFASISNEEKYVFFNENDLPDYDLIGDDKIEEFSENYDPKVLSQGSKLAINSSDKCVRFFFETEFDIFQNKGTEAKVEFFITSLYNQVGILYQNENVGTYISQIFIWNTTDPYTETNINALLTKFQDTRTSFEGDLGQLLTFRNVNGGLAAGRNGLCNVSVREKLSVAQITSTFNNFPVYSRPVKVMTHEFGHLLGSRHTHDCVWGSNSNTAIDACSTPACASGGIPSNGGTIMSYCDQAGNPGVNFIYGFGLQPGNVIRNSVANASCLCNCLDSSISGTGYLCSTSSYTLNNPPSGSSISWSVNPVNLFSGSTSGTGTSVSLTPYHSNTRGQAILNFTITTSCGVFQYNKPIWVQAPAPPSPITGNTSPGLGSLTPYYINNLPAGATSMTWSLPYCVGCSQPWSFYSGQNDILITANVGDSQGYVQAMGVNPCGTGGASLLYVTPSGSCDPCARTFPNPVSNEMTLEWFDREGILINEEVPEYSVTLFSAVGEIIFKDTSRSPNLIINLAQLKNGFYYLHLENRFYHEFNGDLTIQGWPPVKSIS